MSGRIAGIVRVGITVAAIGGTPLVAMAAEPCVGKEPPADAQVFGGRCTIVGREKVSDNRFAVFAMCDNDRIFKTELVHLQNDKWLLERSAENISVIEKK